MFIPRLFYHLHNLGGSFTERRMEVRLLKHRLVLDHKIHELLGIDDCAALVDTLVELLSRGYQCPIGLTGRTKIALAWSHTGTTGLFRHHAWVRPVYREFHRIFGCERLSLQHTSRQLCRFGESSQDFRDG